MRTTVRTTVKSFIGNIEDMIDRNDDFRRVVHTGSHMQLVLMTLGPGEDLREEMHGDTDQFFRIEQGRGEIVIQGHATPVESNTVVIVPAGARHYLTNTGYDPLRFYTLYAPPLHADGTVHFTKAEADRAEHGRGLN
jgi:mannose-6-phosphate isomerase-like protein (cupin superfamily)